MTCGSQVSGVMCGSRMRTRPKASDSGVPNAWAKVTLSMVAAAWGRTAARHASNARFTVLLRYGRDSREGGKHLTPERLKRTA